MCRVEVHKFGFPEIASVFLIGAAVDRERVSVDGYAFLGRFNASAMAFRAEFGFGDV